jgi:hypothetical protein
MISETEISHAWKELGGDKAFLRPWGIVLFFGGKSVELEIEDYSLEWPIADFSKRLLMPALAALRS